MPVAGPAPEGADLMLHLPVEQPLVIGRGRPAGEDAEPAAAGPCRAAAHGHHPLDPEVDSQIHRRSEAGLGVLALGGIGMQQIAGAVHGRQPQAVFLQLARQFVALLALPDGGEIEMGPRPGAPGPHAQLDIGDAALGAPGKHLPPRQLGKGIREDADFHD